jgi:hypothetical protein
MMQVGPRRVAVSAGAQREAWDVERFVRAYDAVAVRRKGWAFERTPERVEYAQREYERGDWRSLAEFAERRYELDQLYGDP